MRESENYRDMLETVRAEAGRLFPGKVAYSAPEIAKILGCCRKTVYNRGFTSGMTAPDIARMLCKRRA